MFVFRFILLAIVLSVFLLNDFCLPLWYLRIPFHTGPQACIKNCQYQISYASVKLFKQLVSSADTILNDINSAARPRLETGSDDMKPDVMAHACKER